MNREENTPVAQAGQEAAQYSIPGNFLIRVLQDALSNKKDIRISSSNLGKIILLGTRDEYFSDSKELESLLCLPARDLSIAPIAREDTPPAGRAGLHAMELMWKTAFYLSSGRLVEGYHLHDVVKLSSWPNLTRLPVTPNTFRILAFFSRRPTSVYFAARLLKIPQAEMNQVYSASRAAGYIESINRISEERAIPPHRGRTFLSSLLRRIAGR